jgi:hypothetical protein
MALRNHKTIGEGFMPPLIEVIELDGAALRDVIVEMRTLAVEKRVAAKYYALARDRDPLMSEALTLEHWANRLERTLAPL